MYWIYNSLTHLYFCSVVCKAFMVQEKNNKKTLILFKNKTKQEKQCSFLPASQHYKAGPTSINWFSRLSFWIIWSDISKSSYLLPTDYLSVFKIKSLVKCTPYLPHEHGIRVLFCPWGCSPCTGKFLHRLQTLVLSSGSSQNFLLLICPWANFQ